MDKTSTKFAWTWKKKKKKLIKTYSRCLHAQGQALSWWMCQTILSKGRVLWLLSLGCTLSDKYRTGLSKACSYIIKLAILFLLISLYFFLLLYKKKYVLQHCHHQEQYYSSRSTRLCLYLRNCWFPFKVSFFIFVSGLVLKFVYVSGPTCWVRSCTR